MKYIKFIFLIPIIMALIAILYLKNTNILDHNSQIKLEHSSQIITKNETSNPTEIIFPTKLFNKTCKIIPVGIDKNNRIIIPNNINMVYWYKYSPIPGNKGNSIIAGHRDWNGKIGIFKYLENISIGEKVIIKYANDNSNNFIVVSKKEYDYNNVPKEIMNTQDGNKVTLISCTGSFNKKEHTYQKREFVILKKLT